MLWLSLHDSQPTATKLALQSRAGQRILRGQGTASLIQKSHHWQCFHLHFTATWEINSVTQITAINSSGLLAVLAFLKLADGIKKYFSTNMWPKNPKTILLSYRKSNDNIKKSLSWSAKHGSSYEPKITTRDSCHHKPENQHNTNPSDSAVR